MQCSHIIEKTGQRCKIRTKSGQVCHKHKNSVQSPVVVAESPFKKTVKKLSENYRVKVVKENKVKTQECPICMEETLCKKMDCCAAVMCVSCKSKLNDVKCPFCRQTMVLTVVEKNRIKQNQREARQSSQREQTRNDRNMAEHLQGEDPVARIMTLMDRLINRGDAFWRERNGRMQLIATHGNRLIVEL